MSDDRDCIHRSLSRISLFFRLRGRPGSGGDHTLFRQQTLGTSCLPWSYPHRVSCQPSDSVYCRAWNAVGQQGWKRMAFVTKSADVRGHDAGCRCGCKAVELRVLPPCRCFVSYVPTRQELPKWPWACRGGAAHLLNSIHRKGEMSRRVVGRFGGKHEANKQPRVQDEITGRHVRPASDWLYVG